MAYLDALVILLKRCKQRARQMARKKDQVANGMWKERGSRLCLILASQLIEMKVQKRAVSKLNSHLTFFS